MKASNLAWIPLTRKKSITEVLSYLHQELNIAQFTRTVPTDNPYDRWEFDWGGTMMPSSPGVQDIRLLYYYDQHERVLRYHFTYQLHPATVMLVNRMSPHKIKHRSRVAAVAWRPLCIYEQERKRDRIREIYPDLVKAALSDRESYELSEIYFEVILESMNFDYEYFIQYCRKHKNSSLGGGFSWADLEGLSPSEARALYDRVRQFTQSLADNRDSWLDISWRYGLRARSDSLVHSDLVGHFESYLDRTRVVQFHTVIQLQNAFIQNKKRKAEVLFSKVIDHFRISAELHFATVEGGLIYKKASDLIAQYGRENYHAYDGKNWESSVATLLGPSFRFTQNAIDGEPSLATGGFFTTDAGSLASALEYRDEPNAVVCILGDDQANFKGRIRPRPHVEEDDDDSLAKYFLGFSYIDELNPTFYGLKLTSDNSTKGMGIRQDPVAETTGDKWSQFKDEDHTSSIERVTWLGGYFGKIGNTTLLDAVTKNSASDWDWISPSRVIDDLVKSTRDIDDLARELGIHHLV